MNRAGPKTKRDDPGTIAALRALGEYRASAIEAADILGVSRSTAKRWAARHSVALRVDRPGAYRYFNKHVGRRGIVMQKYREAHA
jgi:transposase